MSRLHFAYICLYQVFEYHMEFLETFGCIWSSKEVIRVVFGRALPGATSRSDGMRSLCTTSRSDSSRATAQSRSQRRAEVAPEAWSDLTRATGRSRSPFWFSETRNRSRSDLSQRPSEVAPEAQSDVLERLAEVAARRLSARIHVFSRAFLSFYDAPTRRQIIFVFRKTTNNLWKGISLNELIMSTCILSALISLRTGSTIIYTTTFVLGALKTPNINVTGQP
ncbi:hypothetical protein IGI04_025005 [Brassica rapa subsp. trilocularis]|uniref:ABC transmembrane type-1 domain-containing protein n=1 Tax=Brassica rapa subsp. trilocularis TaxID=1813537 RepID=A0ABQ7M8D2_BRACM|nr:hypothetical protein IGI04_025005 [Brassica rapa subsp. trilocularis]